MATRVATLAASLRREPGDARAWVELATALARQGAAAAPEIPWGPEARAGCAAALRAAPEARELARWLLGSRGLVPGAGSSVDPGTGLPRRATLARWAYPMAWVPGAGGSPGVYLGVRPVTADEYRAWRPEACPDPRAWERQLIYPARPVVFVTWEEAVVFAAAQGARLPRRGERRRAEEPDPWAREEPDGVRPVVARSGWEDGLQPADSGAEGAWGHQGLRHNVRDWCLDAGELAGADAGELGRLVAGGDWVDGGVLAGPTREEALPQTQGYGTVGIRLAADVLAETGLTR